MKHREKAKARVGELRRLIRHHDYPDYILSRPAIYDTAYDRLYTARTNSQ